MALDWNRIIAISDDGTVDSFGIERVILVTGQKGDKGDTVSAQWGTITGDVSNQSDLMEAIRSGSNGGNATWGNISGALGNQTDLVDALNAKAPITSPTFSGTPKSPTPTKGDNSTKIATTAFVQTAIAESGGGSSSGDGGGDGASWGRITGTLSDQDDLQTALDTKAPLASPKLTGNPTAPTQAKGNNSTRIATTAFVQNALADYTPGSGSGEGGGEAVWGGITGTLSNQTDLTNILDTKAPLASPALTGNPTAPTQAKGNSSTRLATTEFVQTALSDYTPSSSAAWGNITGILSNQTDLTNALASKQDNLIFDDTPTENSDNPVTSDGIYNALGQMYTKEETDALFSPVSDSASGNIVTIPDGGENIRLIRHIVTIEPSQSGSGIPSASNIRPISGYSGATIYHSGSDTSSPDTYEIDFINREAQQNYITIANVHGSIGGTLYFDSTDQKTIKLKGETVGISQTIEGYSTGSKSFSCNVHAGRYKFYGLPAETKGVTIQFVRLSGGSYDITNNGIDSGEGFYLTAYGDLEGYFNIIIPDHTRFGSDYSYVINPYMQELISDFYGGTLDVFNGVLTTTKECIQSYNGEPLSGEWISDRDIYSAGATPTIGAQVVYTLSTPKSYNVDSVKLFTLLGVNNFWCNIGNTEITYYVNLPLFIAKITGGSSAGGGEAVWGGITGTLSDQTDLTNILNTKAPLASPELTGNPTAPTQAKGNNSTRIATTAFVQTAIGDVNNMNVHICTTGEYNATTYIPTVSDPDESTFYLVPDGSGTDMYSEWIYVNNGWERFGSARIDLSNYVTTNNLLTALATKQDTLTFDATPTENSTNPVTSDGVYDALATKQNVLTFDNTPIENSINPVTSDGVYDALADKADSNAVYTKGEVDTLFSPVLVSTSGNIVHITDGGDNLRLRSHVITIEPSQSGSGVPSSSNIRPISGYSGATIYHSNADRSTPQTNVIDFAELQSDTNYATVAKGTLTRSNLHLTYDGTTISAEGVVSSSPMTFTNSIVTISVPSGRYKFTSLPTGGDYPPTLSVTLEFQCTSGTYEVTNDGIDSGDGFYLTANGNVTGYMSITFTGPANLMGKQYVISPFLQELSANFYGGTLDVINGVLTATKGIISSYNGESLSGEWISDRDVYSAGATPTIGAQVVYTLSTPKAYDVDSVTLSTFLGENYFWCDIGNTSIQYYVNTALYIARLVNGGSGGGSAVWGGITGTLSNQTDLANALAGKQNSLTFDTVPTASSSNPVTSGGVKTALDEKQNALTFDTAPTASSSNPVTSGGVKTALDDKANLASPTFTGTPKAPTATAGTNTTQIATTAFVQSALDGKAPLASPALTGNPTAPTQSSSDNSTKIATTAFVKTAVAEASSSSTTAAWGNISGTLSNQTDLNTALNAKAPLASPALTGNPTAPTQSSSDNSTKIATTAFVKTAVAEASGGDTASWGNISGTLSNQTDLSTALSGKQNVLTFDTTPTASSSNPVTSGGVKTALDNKANLASPTFTGTPKAPTATSGTNTTQIATTAFVQNAVSNKSTAWGGITGTLANQTDLNTALNAKAPLASPTFTGTPTAPTPAENDSSTKIATTAFVDNAVEKSVGELSDELYEYIDDSLSEKADADVIEPVSGTLLPLLNANQQIVLEITPIFKAPNASSHIGFINAINLYIGTQNEESATADIIERWGIGNSHFAGCIFYPQTGKLLGTWGYIESYNGETLPGEWKSDIDTYVQGTTPTTGARVAYEFAEPVEITESKTIALTDSMIGKNFKVEGEFWYPSLIDLSDVWYANKTVTMNTVSSLKDYIDNHDAQKVDEAPIDNKKYARQNGEWAEITPDEPTAPVWGDITGTLSDQTDLQTALNAKAPLASPAFTGNPTAPTQSFGNSSTRIATTSFVQSAIATKQDTLSFDTTPTASSTKPVTSGGIKTALDSKANLASPAFTGNPTATTQTKGNNSTRLATTAFVQTAIGDKQDTLTFDTTPTASSTNPVTSGGIKTALDAKQDILTFDTTPTANSTNPVTSGGVKTALNNKNNYGYCTTAAETVAKEVQIEGFELVTGVTIHVKFQYANSASNPTLNVSGTGAKNLYRYGTTRKGATTGTNGWQNNAILAFTYDGSGWIETYWYNNTYTVLPTAYCSTAAATADKTASCSYYTLKAGYFELVVRYANGAEDALTLNVASTGALPVYINGEPSSATNYTLSGGVYIVYCDGENYYFDTTGKIPHNVIVPTDKVTMQWNASDESLDFVFA